MIAEKLVGQSIRRKEDPRLLRGEGAYSEDITPPGTVWAAFVRSPYAHARIRSIDHSVAMAHPSVLTVMTGADIHPKYHPLPPVPLTAYGAAPAPFYLIATDKARYGGEIVAMVVAADRYAARDAADTIVVDYEVLPVVNDPESAMRPDAPRVHDDRGNGDLIWRKSTANVHQAFEEAEVILRDHFVNQRIHAVPLEPRAGIAHWDPVQRTLTVWASMQSAHELREQMSEVLGIPFESIRVVAPDVGGGFGAKHAGEVEYFLIAAAALRLGLPVKWVGTRSEEFLGLSHARGKTSDIEIAATRDGRITGIRLRHIADLGAYPKGGTPSINITSAMIALGGYKIPEIDLDVQAVYTNHTPEGAYRGYGRPEGIHLIEREMDSLAYELGLDPAEVRRRNFIPPDAFPYVTAAGEILDSGNYAVGLEKALEMSDYNALREEQARLRSEGRFMGIGLSSWIKTGGFGPSSLSIEVGAAGARSEAELLATAPAQAGASSFNPAVSMPEWARFKVEPSGKVTIYTGSSPHGQGNVTTFSQVAADVLQVPIDRIDVVYGDTGAVAYGVGTFASRNMVVGGTAVYQAAQKIVAKMRQIAAHRLGVAIDGVIFEEGFFSKLGASIPRLSVADVAVAASTLRTRPAGMEMGLDESSFYQPSRLTFNSGTYVAVVEVDPNTGDVDLHTLFCVDDQGIVVNPMIVEGQVHGGAAQGIGQALYERIVYDENGQLLSGSLMDYALPTAEMLPKFVTATIETPSPTNPLGVKGMGEGPTTGAPPAVVNAVVDALRTFGVRDIDMPLTPERVWRAIEAAKQAHDRGGRR
ncbi:MAG: xanthine dehydrogenase family protein molybdopterin-binding subunit [Chloroflexi bacterium]|nr:xanthine dehydrogenase family protein molybdopterin-binding subunit [Chloroflexota bacterium]